MPSTNGAEMAGRDTNHPSFLDEYENAFENEKGDPIVEAIHSEINESFRFIDDEISRRTTDSSLEGDSFDSDNSTRVKTEKNADSR